MTSEPQTRKRVVVLGGASGFVGRSIVRRFLSRGAEVRTIDRRQASLNRDIDLKSTAEITFDWKDPHTLVSTILGFRPDHVVHAVGSASVAASMDQPAADFAANVETFRVLLEAIRTSELRVRVTLISSAAVYGNPGQLPVSETQDTHPISTYGFDKVLAETLARCYAELYGVPTTVLRVFSVVGAEQRRLLPFELWSQATRASRVTLLGSGAESRDFLHIDDLGEAVVQLCERPAPPPFEVLNVGSGVEVTTRAVANLIRDHVAPNKPIEFRNERPLSDPVRWCADISRLRVAIPNWSPRSIESTLEDSCNAWTAADLEQ